ncbi:MAG: radical SAM protein [Pseudomonadota bacterium]
MNPLAAPQRLAKLTIEITTLCNLKCAGCPRTTAMEKGAWADLHIPLERFQRILDHIPYTEFVTLHGIGEPTLHPQFNELVAMARASGKFGRMKMTTNALARTVEYYAQSVAAGLDEFWISVDSLDQAIAERMRFGTKVEKLERQVGGLMAAGLPVHISMVVSAQNYRDIPATLMKLHALGRPPVHMQEFQDFGDPYGLMSNAQRAEFLNGLAAVLPRIPGMKIIPPNFTRPKGEICTAPWFRPAISVEGYLTPCCTTFDPEQFGRVNLVELSFEEAWRQPSLLDWIKRFVRNETPICHGCPLNPRAFGMDAELGRSGKTGQESHVIKPKA